MWISKRTCTRYALLGLLIVALAVLVVGCGKSSTTTTTAAPTTTSGATTTTGASSSTSVSLTGDAATIAANWVKFFDGTQPAADKVGLLENGAQYKQQIDAQAASPLAQQATASVQSVTVTSATTADVTYSILVGGVAALPNQPGKAVLQDGVWKVSAESFLALLALEGAAGSPGTS